MIKKTFKGPGIRCTFEAAESIDLTAVGMAGKIAQTACQLSNDGGRRTYEIGYRVKDATVSISETFEPLESKRIILPPPELNIGPPSYERLTFFVNAEGLQHEESCDVHLLNGEYIDTKGEFLPDMMVRRVTPDDADIEYYMQQEGGVEEMMEAAQIVPGRYRNDWERIEVMKIIFRQISSIEDDVRASGIREFMSPAKVISDERGDSYERACLFASMAEHMKLDSSFLFLENGCIIGTVMDGGIESETGDYTVSILYRDKDPKGNQISKRINIVPLDLMNRHDNFFTAVDSGISIFNHNMLHFSTDGNCTLVSQKRNNGITVMDRSAS